MALSLPSKPNATLSELAVCSAITVIMWVLNVTLIFPLFIALKMSSWVRMKFFCWIMTITTFRNMLPVITEIRKRMFEMLEQQRSNRGAPKKTMRVLEIGVGNGLNFKHYSENFSATLLDANPNFLSNIKATIKTYPKINIERIVQGRAENMTEIGDEEFDLVLATHLLCSVSDVEAVLKEVKRVLKKDGQFLFMEHISFPENHPAYRIQSCLSPLWKVYFDGCELNRCPQKAVKPLFSSVHIEMMYPPSLFLFIRPHVIGIVTK